MKKNILKSVVTILSIVVFWACTDSDSASPSPYGNIQVSVLDIDQQPISDAEIALAVVGEDFVVKKISDAEGMVTFPEVLGDIPLIIYTTDPLFVSDQVDVMATAETTVTAAIVLEPNTVGALELLVIDGNEEVVPDMEVIIKTKIGGEIVVQENTNSEGKIILNELSAIEYLAYSSADGYVSDELSFIVLPGQLNTPTLVVEKLENYAVKMSKNGYLDPSEMAPYGSTYTISGMVKPTGSGVRTISGFGNADGFSSFFRLEGDNHLYLGQWSGAFKKARSGAPLVNDEWSHFALVVNNNEVSFYINGVDVGAAYASGEAPMDNAIEADNFKFGALYQTGFNYGEAFDGGLDNLAFWTTARTAGEIESEAASELTGEETGLWGYWNFEDNAGSTTIDLSGSEHPLEIGGNAEVYVIGN